MIIFYNVFWIDKFFKVFIVFNYIRTFLLVGGMGRGWDNNGGRGGGKGYKVGF